MKWAVVTGAGGFVGRRLCAHLAAHGWKVAAALRSDQAPPELSGCELHRVSGLSERQEWAAALQGADVVFHLAARAHVMSESAADPLAEYRRINCRGTLDLARFAAGYGVGRFVFLSTIKVNGERTASRPFNESDPAAPVDPYAVSKWEAEQGLARIAAETGITAVAVRPPLVYGPWVKGNFLRLLRLARSGFPLPLASIANLRSLIYVGNLADALERLATASLPRTSTYLVSDDRDYSTPGLLREICAAMRVRPRLVSCPPRLLAAAGVLIGRREEARRMIESLRADCSRIKEELQWRPPFSPEEGIADTVAWFQRLSSPDGPTTGK